LPIAFQLACSAAAANTASITVSDMPAALRLRRRQGSRLTLVLALQQCLEVGERLVRCRRVGRGTRRRRALRIVLELARVLVVVTVDAQQLQLLPSRLVMIASRWCTVS
jgi:hypothetical protein